jgi:hydroxymethylglutaryl-CoA synthase
MSASCIHGAWGRPGGKGERAVANFDEDSITMGVSAGMDCLRGAPCGEEDIEGLYFSTTTPPYREKSSAATIATALDLRGDLRTMDCGASLRSSVSALLSAADAVETGRSGPSLVVGADCRLAEPGSPLEPVLGDGAASVLVGREGVRAEILDAYSVSDDIMDLWRRDEDPFIIQDDVRFAQIYGFQHSATKAAEGLMSRMSLQPKDFAKVLITPVDARSHGKVAAKLGFDVKAQLIAPPAGIGLCGTALPLLLLASALDELEPGQLFLLIAYGDGADAVALRAVDGVRGGEGRTHLQSQLDARRELDNYTKFLSFHHLIRGQGPLTAPFSSSTLVYREKETNLKLYARECEECGKIQFLRDVHVCPGCYAQDRFRTVKLSKEAVLFSYNQEYYYPSPDPPTTMAIIDFPEGARMTTQMTDVDPKDVRVEMPVEMCFRKFHDGNYFHNYFWKCRPKA